MNTVVRSSKKAQQDDLVRARDEQLALISTLEQQSKLESQNPMDGGIEPVRIVRLSRCDREDVTWPDRSSLSFDDVGAAAFLDEDNLQEAMGMRPVSRGVSPANEPARIYAWSASNIAQVSGRKDADSRWRSTRPAVPICTCA
jgi:hypothetical protein